MISIAYEIFIKIYLKLRLIKCIIKIKNIYIPQEGQGF